MFYYMARFGDGVDIYLHKSAKPCYFASRLYMNSMRSDVSFSQFKEWCNHQTVTEWTTLTRITEKFYKYMEGPSPGYSGSYGRESRIIRMNQYFNTGGVDPAILENPARKTKAPPKYYLAHWIDYDNLIYVRQSSHKYSYAVVDNTYPFKVLFTSQPKETTVPLHLIDEAILIELQSVPLEAQLSQLVILASHNLL